MDLLSASLKICQLRILMSKDVVKKMSRLKGHERVPLELVGLLSDGIRNDAVENRFFSSVQPDKNHVFRSVQVEFDGAWILDEQPDKIEDNPVHVEIT